METRPLLLLLLLVLLLLRLLAATRAQTCMNQAPGLLPGRHLHTHLHAPRPPDAAVRNVAIAANLVGCVNNHDPPLAVVCQQSRDFSDGRRLADTGAAWGGGKGSCFGRESKDDSSVGRVTERRAELTAW
jgi:hypothetical protein